MVDELKKKRKTDKDKKPKTKKVQRWGAHKATLVSVTYTKEPGNNGKADIPMMLAEIVVPMEFHHTNMNIIHNIAYECVFKTSYTKEGADARRFQMTKAENVKPWVAKLDTIEVPVETKK